MDQSWKAVASLLNLIGFMRAIKIIIDIINEWQLIFAIYLATVAIFDVCSSKWPQLISFGSALV